MARKLRVQYPGAIYHVRNRVGNFGRDLDCERFIQTLGEVDDSPIGVSADI
jgi:hypothetical protein